MTDQESPAPAPEGMPPPPSPPRAPASWGSFGQAAGGGPHGAMPGMNAPPVAPEEHHEHIGAHNYGKDGEVRIISQVPIDKRLADDYTPYLKVGGLVLLLVVVVGGGLFGAMAIFGGEDEPEVAAVEPTTTVAQGELVWDRQRLHDGSLALDMPPVERQERSVETATGTATTTLLFADLGNYAIAAGYIAFGPEVEMDIRIAASDVLSQVGGEVRDMEDDLSGYLEAADIEGSGVWKGKEVVVVAHLQKVPTGAAILLGLAPADQSDTMRADFGRMSESFTVNG